VAAFIHVDLEQVAHVVQAGGGGAQVALLSIALGESWGFDYSALAWGSVFLQTAVGAFASYLTWM
jgi:hypothetical protein